MNFNPSYDNELDFYFINLEGDSINVWNNGRKLTSDFGIVQSVDESREAMGELIRPYCIIYADKDIQYHYIKDIKREFARSLQLRLDFVVENEHYSSYMDIYGIPQRIPHVYDEDYDKLPDDWKSFFIQDSSYLDSIYRLNYRNKSWPLVAFYNDSIIWDKQNITKQEFETSLDNFTKTYEGKKVLLYYIGDSTTYQNYIFFLEQSSKTFYNQRNLYAVNNYNKPLEELNDSIKRLIRKKFPMMLIEISKEKMEKLSN